MKCVRKLGVFFDIPSPFCVEVMHESIESPHIKMQHAFRFGALAEFQAILSRTIKCGLALYFPIWRRDTRGLMDRASPSAPAAMYPMHDQMPAPTSLKAILSMARMQKCGTMATRATAV